MTHDDAHEARLGCWKQPDTLYHWSATCHLTLHLLLSNTDKPVMKVRSSD